IGDPWAAACGGGGFPALVATTPGLGREHLLATRTLILGGRDVPEKLKSSVERFRRGHLADLVGELDRGRDLAIAQTGFSRFADVMLDAGRAVASQRRTQSNEFPFLVGQLVHGLSVLSLGLFGPFSLLDGRRRLTDTPSSNLMAPLHGSSARFHA